MASTGLGPGSTGPGPRGAVDAPDARPLESVAADDPGLPINRAPGTPPGAAASIERAVLAAALDPIIVIDAAGVIQSASNSVQRVFGWTPPELAGRNVNILMPDPRRVRRGVVRLALVDLDRVQPPD